MKIKNLARLTRGAEFIDYSNAFFPIYYMPQRDTYLWEIGVLKRNNGTTKWVTTLVIESKDEPKESDEFDAFSLESFISRFQGELKSVPLKDK